MGRDLLSQEPSPAQPLSALGQVLGLADDDLDFYRSLLGRPSLPLATLAELTGLPPTEAADRLQRLVSAGAVASCGADQERYRARHPELAIGDQLGQLRRLLAEADDEVAELAELAGHRAGDRTVERLTGLEQVREGLTDLVQGAQSRIAVVARPELALPWTAAAGPGLCARTVWPDRADVVETLVPPLQMVASTGAVRAAATLPPCGLVLVDDRAALVVSVPDGPVVEAVVHRHLGTVAAYAAFFELLWRSARPVWPLPSAEGELTEADRALLGMLHLGLTDAAVANRLSISVRTVGRRLEALMSRLDARTRFQAGAEAARRGWL